MNENFYTMGKSDSESNAAFTPDKIKLYEEYLRTGKINGKVIDNPHAVAREIGTSMTRINKWHYDQNIKMREEKDMTMKELEILQKRTQTELIELIVKVALVVILSVGLITTAMYVLALVFNYERTIIESTWSNLFGILLTNSFSIIGTIMGVKYATAKRPD